ncbi:MAG TPA: hypothetical protein VGB97_01980 [Candidatus Paceibacterota bacterium]|jgi:hypothetical protein
MPLFKAFGFGVLLIVLRLMLPNVLHEGEQTAIVFLEGAQASALTATTIIEHAATTTSLSDRPQFSLPHAPYPAP